MQVGSGPTEEGNILRILKSLDVIMHNAACLDGLSSRVLEECAQSSFHLLCGSLTCLLTGSKLMSQFIKSLKPGGELQASVPTLYLCQEKSCIHFVFPVIENYIYPLQHSFMKGRSTVM